MKKLILLSFLFLSNLLFSQSGINYYYDAAGNRVLRKIIALYEFSKAPEKPSKPLLTDQQGAFTFNVFPNPNFGHLKIQVDRSFFEKGTATLEVIDLQGKKLVEQNYAENETGVDVSQLPVGSYILRIRSSKGFVGEWNIVKVE